MTFRRTSQGLRNQPVFFDSDIVVYVEGGSDDIAEDEGDAGEAMTQDALFWNGVISEIIPEKRLHFKSLGSKTALMKFSSGLDEKVRGSLLICIDRDFEGITPKTVSFNFLISTYRYSWESDIWTWVNFKTVLKQILPSENIPAAIESVARASRDVFFAKASKFVRLDAQLHLCPMMECFLPRGNPASIVVRDKKSYPKLNVNFLKLRAREFRSKLERPWRPGISDHFDQKRHFFGKAVDRYHCQLVISCVQSYGLPSNIPFFILQNSAIRFLPKSLSDSERVRQLQHYSKSILSAL